MVYNIKSTLQYRIWDRRIFWFYRVRYVFIVDYWWALICWTSEMGWSLGGRRRMVRRMNFRLDITSNFSNLVNLATPKKMCGFGPSFLWGWYNVCLQMHYNVRYNPACNESRTKLLPSEIRWDTNGTVFTSVENMDESGHEKKWSKSLWRLYVLWTQRNLVYTDACYYCLCSQINEETKNNCSNYRSTGYSFYFNLSSGTVLTLILLWEVDFEWAWLYLALYDWHCCCLFRHCFYS